MSGKVKQMVCCEVNANLAYCDTSTRFCVQHQVMTGIVRDDTTDDIIDRTHCCALTDQFEGLFS